MSPAPGLSPDPAAGAVVVVVVFVFPPAVVVFFAAVFPVAVFCAPAAPLFVVDGVDDAVVFFLVAEAVEVSPPPFCDLGAISPRGRAERVERPATGGGEGRTTSPRDRRAPDDVCSSNAFARVRCML